MSSRTSALSRYLAAVEPAQEGSTPRNNSLPPNTTSSVSDNSFLGPPDGNEPMFEASFTNDLYNGHKVVAMPSALLGGKSVREVVSSRNGNGVSASSSTTQPSSSSSSSSNDRRSRSTGRTTPRSRDIVQDVYDRMGVAREDLAATDRTNSRRDDHQPMTADKFHERYRAAAVLSAASPSSSSGNTRGRALEHRNTDGNRRARSLSQGRTIAARWPPTPPADGQASSKNVQASSSITLKDNETAQFLSGEPTGQISPSKQDAGMSTPSKQAQDLDNPIMVAGRSSFNSPGEPMSWKKSSSALSTPQQEEFVEDQSAGGTIRSLSVRQRISALGGNRGATTPTASSSKNFQRAYPPQYTKRSDFPPKIDIYEEARRREETSLSRTQSEDDDVGLAPEPSTVPPSPAAAAAADAAAELVRRQEDRAKKISRGKSTGSIGEAFLASIGNRGTVRAPVTEIAADDSGGVVDVASVALSSVSDDEFVQAPPKTNRDVSAAFRAKPAWGGGGGYTGHNSQGNAVRASPARKPINGTSISKTSLAITSSSNNNNNNNISSEMLNKLVEERVRAHVSELESRIEAQMLRLENRMEDRIKARMGVLENKIDKIGSMLSVLLSNNRHAEI